MRLGKTALLAFGLTLGYSSFVAGSAQSVNSAPAEDFPSTSVVPFPGTAPGSNVETLHVTTREILVDVMVTDANGNPVRGLKQSDFSIEENDKPQSIRSFREFGSEIPAAEPAAPQLPLGVYTNSQSTPATGPVNILLLDALHSDSVSVVRGLQAAADYVTSMPQGTKLAVFWLSSNGLHLLQGFTADRESLLRAVRTGRTDFGACLNGQCLTKYLMDRSTIDAMNQIAAYVAGIKGRKNLLWITPGMPVDLMRDGGYAWAGTELLTVKSKGGNSRGGVFGNDVAGPDMSLVHRLMDVYERFTAEQIAVSPIDPRGVLFNMGMTQLKVEAVAADTGGEAFYNSNDLKSEIAKAVDDGSRFYTLSYIPPTLKDDGHYHHIKVAVSQPGLHLVYRQGYNAERVPTLDSPAPGPAMMKASMEGNAPVATQILFDVGVWPNYTSITGFGTPMPASAKAKPGKTVPYEIQYGFPASEIAFTEDADGMLHGSLEFDVVAYDVFRKRVALLTQTVKMTLSLREYDTFAAKPYQFTQQIDLPPGQISLHVGILDTVTSKVGTLEIPVNVVQLTAKQRAAIPPDVAPAPCPPRCPLPSAAPDTAPTTH
ncbi:MAG TPA: VWA domain-containing protein [Acidobacteriaceae bacterium]|jgi:VWFA-related protein|nr:VWA domain-containing protein [Acidobacteriaceae bacterium]